MAGRIHRIDVGVNCYLIGDERGRVLIDTGFRSKRARLDAELAAAGCRPAGLRLIVLTHGDVDHTGNGEHLRSTYGGPIAIHEADAKTVRTEDMRVGRKDKPERRTLLLRARKRMTITIHGILLNCRHGGRVRGKTVRTAGMGAR